MGYDYQPQSAQAHKERAKGGKWNEAKYEKSII
jgi:hypothetical protein